MDSHYSDSPVVYTVQEYQAEQVYFNEYDMAMEEAINDADRYIEELHQMQQQEEEVGIDSEIIQEEQQAPVDENYIIDESLLRLIVDVQSYLTEAPTDSPLLKLQYKMYTYFKQRVTEMDVEQTNSNVTF
ncbi:hypothetical protein K501DRAFT_287593 [Backusella circina FSU 941]|nr:hypothetical protein K501DRAFT_287593 [Backusella circina FSU 941]